MGYAASLGDIIGTLGGATVSLTLGGGVSDCGSTLGAGSSVWGDRDIRPATKSDMIRFGSSFSLAYIKIIPFSRGIRIFRSPGMNSFLYK